MRRGWRRIALPAVVLLLFAASGGLLWVLTAVPSLTADALTRALGRRVELGSIEVLPALRIEVQVRSLRVYPGDDLTQEPLLEAPLARGYQSWARVLVGQLVPVEWELEEPVARVELAPEAASGELPEFPLRSLRTVRGRLEIDAGERGRFLVEDLNLEVARRALLPGLRGRVEAQVSGPPGLLGSIDLAFDQGGDDVRVSGDVTGVSLSRARRLMPEAFRSYVSALGGIARGQVGFEWSEGEARLATDLALTRFSAEIAGFNAPVKTAETRIALEVARGADTRWSVRARPVRLDDLELRGSVEVDPRPGGRIQADLEVAPFDIVRRDGRLSLISLLGLRIGLGTYLDKSLTGGALETVKLELNVPFEELPGVLSLSRALAPEEIRLELAVRDVVLEPGEGFPAIERITGRFEFQGDRLRVEQLALARADTPLPTVNLEIQGIAQFVHLPPEELQIPEGPGLPLSGLRPAFVALRTDPDPERGGPTAPADPLLLRVQNLWLNHPALVFQVRNANGPIRFEPDRLVVEDAIAVISGGRARLDLRWVYDPNVIDAAIRYLPGPVPPRVVPPGRWLDGSIALPRAPIGLWKLQEVSSRVFGEAGDLLFEDVRADLAGGVLRGKGRVDLAREGDAPLDFALTLDEADAGEATAFMELERASVTGKASADLFVRGALSPEAPFVSSCDLSMEVELREGTLVNMPIALQIARLPSLEGIRGLFGQALPYDSVTGQLALRGGVLEVEEFAILSNQLRALMQGNIDLNTEERESDLRIAFLFLQTLDTVLEKVPFVGKLILGQDGSLITMSFRVRGPFGNPSVSPATPATLQSAADWTGSWLRGMRNLIPGLRGGSSEGPQDPPAGGEPKAEPGEADESSRQDR